MKLNFRVAKARTLTAEARSIGPPGLSVTDLRTIEDWQLERRFKAVPGVIDVNGWGGKSKTYEVSVDLKKLNDAGITLQQVIQALGGNDLNVGGQTLNFGPTPPSFAA